MFRFIGIYNVFFLGLWCVNSNAEDMKVCENNLLYSEDCNYFHGSIRLNSFSTNNAYFSNTSEDTTTLGGYVNFESERINGFKIKLGVEGQHIVEQGAHSISDLNSNTFGLGEANLNWSKNNFKITLGNQRLDLPFIGDWADWRVQPWLYQALDLKYGNNDDFIRVTKINKYKNYADNKFNKENGYFKDNYLDFNEKIDNTWIYGFAKKIELNNILIRNQFWLERYKNMTDIYYGETNWNIKNISFDPELSFQIIYGLSNGDKFFGDIKNKTLGARVKLNPFEDKSVNLSFSFNYSYFNSKVWNDGRLVVPYAHNTSSGPYFAQPFFTSTQDYGAGKFFSLEIFKPRENLFISGKLSYLNPDKRNNNEDVYEIMGMVSHNLKGKLNKFNIANFIGFQKKQDDKNLFLQSRLSLSYNF